MTISANRLTFNTACLKKFENVEYVELLFKLHRKVHCHTALFSRICQCDTLGDCERGKMDRSAQKLRWICNAYTYIYWLE